MSPFMVTLLSPWAWRTGYRCWVGDVNHTVILFLRIITSPFCFLKKYLHFYVNFCNMRPYIFKYMDQQDLQQLHKDLIARKEQLEAEMTQVANPNPAVEGDSEVKTHTSNNSGDEDEYAHNVADLSTK